MAVVPAYAGNMAASVSNSSVSTYIVVFNDGPQMKTMAAQSASASVESLGGQVKYRYNIINGMAVTIPDNRAEQLRSLPNVKYVEKDQPVYALLDEAVPQIGADQAWAEGYTGQGVKVAVLDTGVDATHPDLNGTKVIAWKDFTGANYTTPHDGNGHGTHVSGIIAGTGNASNGKYKGVAPCASLIEAKVMNDNGVGNSSWVILAMDWAVANGAQVISLSLGGQHSRAMDDEVAKVTAEGVVVVVAAGNSGPSAGSVECPGDSPDAITVGMVNKSDVLDDRSSRGPTDDGQIKPDVTNVGVAIWSAKAWGTNPSYGTKYYLQMTGTSMATPMTSGVVALMLQKNPSLTPVQVKSILESTAKPMGDIVPNNNYGWGRVQAKNAVDYAFGPETVWSDFGKNNSVIGRVTTSVNGTVGIAGANVALVNAYDPEQEYYHTTTDSYGYYNLTGINATYSFLNQSGPTNNHSGAGPNDFNLGQNMYKIYANKSPYGEGYSGTFGIDADLQMATTTSVIIFTKPARIELKAERQYIVTNSTDNITITANMYDAFGNPVADGYNINFTIGNATNNSFTKGGFQWVSDNGSLTSAGNNVSLNNPTQDNLGEASVNYGWVDAAYSGNSSTIWAYSADNVSVNDSIKIYFDYQSFTYNLSKGWNMISVPLFLQNDSVEAFFPKDVKANITDMWYYNNGSWVYYSGTRGYSPKYAHLTNVTPGQGYWVKLSTNTTFTIIGLNKVRGLSAASSGWTMFGMKGMDSLNATAVYSANKDMWYYSNGQWYYYSATRGYSPKYAHLDRIDPGKGYWVHL